MAMERSRSEPLAEISHVKDASSPNPHAGAYSELGKNREKEVSSCFYPPALGWGTPNGNAVTRKPDGEVLGICTVSKPLGFLQPVIETQGELSPPMTDPPNPAREPEQEDGCPEQNPSWFRVAHEEGPHRSGKSEQTRNPKQSRNDLPHGFESMGGGNDEGAPGGAFIRLDEEGTTPSTAVSLKSRGGPRLSSSSLSGDLPLSSLRRSGRDSAHPFGDPRPHVREDEGVPGGAFVKAEDIPPLGALQAVE